MHKGWLIGDFEPNIWHTKDFEVAIKQYESGDQDPRHHHKEATEFTVVISGEVEMNNIKYKENDIIQINPHESSQFKCIKDATLVVVKTASIKGDKYLD